MRVTARSSIRSTLVAVSTLLTAIVLAVTTTIGNSIGLTATTALIVPGTGVKDPSTIPDWQEHAVDYYVATTTASCQPTCAFAPVPYIAEFWPFPFPGWGGLNGAKWNVSVASGVASLTSKLVGEYNPTEESPDVIFGYSQGATVASLGKRDLSALTEEEQENVAFVLIGNPQRPNGGLFSRLAALGTVPILDATFGRPTPTDTGMATTDIAFQYDGVADFPKYVLNLLADLNALAGFWYVHGSYLYPTGNHPDENPYGYTPAEIQDLVSSAAADCTAANHCQQHGDTKYITIPTQTLPILQPLVDFGKSTGTSALIKPIVDLISPALRVLIETAYDRGDYGESTPARLLQFINPITLTVDLVNAIGEGIKAALGGIGVPLGASATAPAPPASTTTRTVSTFSAVEPATSDNSAGSTEQGGTGTTSVVSSDVTASDDTTDKTGEDTGDTDTTPVTKTGSSATPTTGGDNDAPAAASDDDTKSPSAPAATRTRGKVGSAHAPKRPAKAAAGGASDSAGDAGAAGDAGKAAA